MRPSGVPNRDPTMVKKCFVYQNGRLSDEEMKLLELEDEKA